MHSRYGILLKAFFSFMTPLDFPNKIHNRYIAHAPILSVLAIAFHKRQGNIRYKYIFIRNDWVINVMIFDIIHISHGYEADIPEY